MALGALLAVLACVVVVPVGTASAQVAPGWQVNASFPVDAIACPSVSNCYAVGATGEAGSQSGFIVATTNGGATWTSQTAPSGLCCIFNFYRVACPSDTDCYAVGFNNGAVTGVIVATTNGGATWVSQTLPSGGGDLTAVACPSDMDCYAVGYDQAGTGVIVATTNGGATWVSQTLPSGWGALGLGGALSGIACPSESTCYAVSEGGEIAGTTDSGTIWASQTVPSGGVGFHGIACPSDTTCYAVEGQGVVGILATTNGGTTWTWQTLPSGVGVDYLLGIACPSTSHCYAGGAGPSVGGAGIILATPNGGSTWSNQELPSGVSGVNDIACRSTSHCFAVGYNSSGGLILKGPGVETTASLRSSANPVETGVAVNYTATVSPIPNGGSVKFTTGSKGIPGCTAIKVNTKSGKAECTVRYGSPGTFTIQAVYSGDAHFPGSESNILQELVIAPTTVSLTSSANPVETGVAVSYTATVSPIPNGGSVKFTSGTKVIGGCAVIPVNTKGKAVCVVRYSRTGTFAIQAVYSGDATFGASKSNVLSELVT